jgi:hypothetical protein
MESGRRPLRIEYALRASHEFCYLTLLHFDFQSIEVNAQRFEKILDGDAPPRFGDQRGRHLRGSRLVVTT